MQLSPLQSRLVASILASFAILILYLVLFPPSFALAAELPFDSSQHYDFLRDIESPDVEVADPAIPSDLYEPVFSPFGRSIVGRQDTNNFVLADNNPESFDLSPGDSKVFVFEVDAATGQAEVDDDDDGDIQRRQAGTATTVCISANTCKRPDNTNESSRTTVPAPQLTLYLSTSGDNTSPGPDITDSSRQEHYLFTQGAFMLNMTTDSNLYFSISAPDLVGDFSGDYNFQIAASTEACYHVFDDTFDGNITWVQSDASGALLVANDVPLGNNLEALPYVLFAQSRENDWKVNGVLFSFCGMRNYAEVMASADSPTDAANTRVTKRQEDADTNTGTGVKQQFYFNGLEDNSFYWGVLALDRRQTGSGQGGTVFSATNFTTASAGGTCELMFDLSFCTDVAYPVPGNKDKFPSSASLRAFYDNYTMTTFSNFKKALAQIPCEAPASQAYSLVRNCEDCERAYKSWLCSVAIPSCREVTAQGNFLLPRNYQKSFTNGTALPEALLAAARANGTDDLTSRNTFLDETISPGPYKELLPCDNQCFNLVQSCPAALGFKCPRPTMIGFNTSYREQSRGSDQCNNPIVLSGTTRAVPPAAFALSFFAAFVTVLV